MTEKMSLNERETAIRQAATTNNITLLTRDFGRGTDFICQDMELNRSGGVHVIQTFVSEQISEETQIQGRTSRQGQNGSYSMILLNTELETLGITDRDIDLMLKSGQRHTKINEFRVEHFKKTYPATLKYCEEIKEDHNQSNEFLDNLYRGNISTVKQFISDRNRSSAGEEGTMSRTIVLMDATGSMSSLLSNAKRIVTKTFKDAHQILLDSNLSNSFEIQFAAYRNYSSKAESILEFSTWESEPENLRVFMDRITPQGGQGNEAVEIGLFHANRESDAGTVSQVIIIGDMPPNTLNNVSNNREGSGGSSYWSQTTYNESTYYMDELNKLCDKNIPVHCFYVRDDARMSFTEISRLTNGESGSLDVQSSDGDVKLTQLLTRKVLNNIEIKLNMGSKLSNAYLELCQQRGWI